MELCDKKTFFDIQSSFDSVPFTQTEEWLDHMGLTGVSFFVNNKENPSICCFGKENRGRLSKWRLDIQGESVKKGTTPKEIEVFYSELIERGYNIIDVKSLGYYSPEYEVAIRSAGFCRPLINPICDMTILVDLDNHIVHRNWKRNCKKAGELLTFKFIENPSVQECEQFVSMFEELRKTKGLGYSVSKESIIDLFSKNNFKMFIAYDNGDKPICGRIVYLNGDLAYDTYAANSDESRTIGASYFLMDNIFTWLKEHNCKKFDFARIAPGKGSVASVYNFKRYSGGEPISYNGAWCYYKNRKTETIYFLNDFLRKKLSRY